MCFKEIESNSYHSLFSNSNYLCHSCFQKLKTIDRKFTVEGINGIVLYDYNDFLKEILYKLKGCGDIEIASVFLSHRLFPYKLFYLNYVIVPAPSNIEDDNIRGFNHVQEIFRFMKMPIITPIIKNTRFKQSDLNRKEREMVGSKFSLTNASLIRAKRILLVDDVYTTGSTLKACVNLLKSASPKSIKILVISHPCLETND
ncbi:MAG: phosphoribosyltransferase family protein [Bacilli bacterium]